MSKISNLFDIRSNTYKKIYSVKDSKNLLHEEKKVRAFLAEKFVLEYLPERRKGSVTDIGCGVGNVLLQVRKRGFNGDMYGLDVSPQMIDEAKKLLEQSGCKKINYRVGSIDDAQIKSDVVLSIGVLGYQKRQLDFLHSLSNLVELDGCLIFSTANGDSIFRFLRRVLSKLHSRIKGELKSDGIEFQSIREKDVQTVLTSSGFKLEKKVYITFGLGLFKSALECFLDRLLYKLIGNKSIGRFFSLSVLYVYKRKAT